MNVAEDNAFGAESIMQNKQFILQVSLFILDT